MEPEGRGDREQEGPGDSPPEAGDARPTPPPPPGLDPSDDPLYIDPDDPLYIPVPLGEEKKEEEQPAADHVAPTIDADESPGPVADEPALGATAPPAPPAPDTPPDAPAVATEPTQEVALAGTETPAAPAEVKAEAEAPTSEEPAVPTHELGAKRGHKKVYILVAALLCIALLGAAGIAYAGYDYSKKYEGRILPGATVAGVDVGGMTPEDAVKVVKKAVRPQLTRTIDVTWEDRTWSVTPRELGARSNARAAVDAALAASAETTFVEKTRMRVLGEELTFANDVAISYPRAGARGFVEGLASNLHRDPRDAALDYSTGWVEITSSRRGREVNTTQSLRSLRGALVEGSPEAELSVRTTQPEVTEEAYEKVILVRIGENKAYLYEQGKITHEYLVATGQAAYPTPTGVYEVTEKRYMPTWVNPAPDGWGSSMPASIPPGISNPLGLRALNWSASGIRFHGTTATYSLGYNASHGCVRMSNEDVIELYDLVDVGTPIVSLESAAYQPLVEEKSDSEPTAENSAN